ncbi:MAG: hypothetical protein QHH06_06645 [Clostridiales bacterium]|nr:hypothetical protein [Eubacteriales bacterium]MDH7566143.1 hypothetical protein [Clostridiales bacterium]
MVKKMTGFVKKCGSAAKAALKRQDGFGRDEILGTAAVLIIAAFITIPQLRSFVTTLIAALNSWWANTISTRIFPPS